MSQALAEEQKEGAMSPASTWEPFAAEVLKIYESAPATEQSMAEILRPLMHMLYNRVVEDEQFRNQLLQCPDSAGSGSPTWSSTLYESETIRAGLLSVYRDKPVPFHDHPGAIGITLVLSGVARIEYANFVSNNDNNGLVKLKTSRARERLPGQVCWFFEHDRNIHSVEAGTPNTVLLVIHMPHVDTEKQSLYFPVADEEREEGEVFMAHRVKAKRHHADADYV